MKRYINLLIIIFGAVFILLVNTGSVNAQTVTPVVQSITPTSLSSATTAHAINMPATVNSGDLLIALLTSDGTAAVTTPTGWTQLYTNTTSSTVRTGAYYKFADGTEDGTTVNFQTSASEPMVAQVYRITGASTVTSAGPSGTTSTTQDPPSSNPSWGVASNLSIAVASAQNGSRTISSYPTGYSGQGNVGVGTTAGANIASAYLGVATVPVDPASFTWSGTTSGGLSATIVVGPTGGATVEQMVTTESTSGPINIPAVNAGDLLVALITSNTHTAITIPTGWTEVKNSTLSYEGNQYLRYAVFARFAPRNASATTVSFGSATAKSAHVYRISGASDIEVGTADTSGVGGSSVNIPSFAPSWTADRALWIVQYAREVVSTAMTYPTNYTNGTQTGSGGGTYVASAYRTLGAASEDPSAVTTDNHAAGQLIAIRSGSVPVTTTTTHNSSITSSSFYAHGTLNNQIGENVWYGVRYGAGSGYGGTLCEDLPNEVPFSVVGNGSWNPSPQATGLTGGTLYYYCLYAYNATAPIFRFYSPTTLSLTTIALPPTMETVTKYEITSTTANISSSVANDNGASVTVKGVCYSSSNATPTVGQGGTTCTENGTGTGAYTANITGLTANTLYYFRSYATSSAGSGYSSVDSFTTEGGSPAGYPQVISTTGFYQRTDSTSHNITMPATVNSGDLLLAIISNDGSATVTTPTGWTQLFSDASSTYLRLGVYYKFANGTEDGTNVDFVTSASESMVATVYRISDAQSVEAGVSATSISSNAPNSPSLTPSWGAEDTLWLSAATHEYTPASMTGYPSSYTNARKDGDTYSSSQTSQAIGSVRRFLNATTEDPAAFTLSGSMAWVANTIAIRPQPTTPAVTTDAASSVAQTTATINGTANPNGFATTGWFRYYTSNPGTCSDSGGTRSPSSSGTALGSGTTGVAYNRNLTGLTPGTAYWVCAIASNTHGTTWGSPVSFTTLAGTPTSVSANGADDPVGSFYATINGIANPNNFSSFGFFRVYDADPGSCTDSGGTRYPSSSGEDQSIGSTGTNQNFSYSIESGLTPDTAYYFCAFARNSYGTVGSSVDTFTTPDGPANACDPPASGNHTISGSCSYTSGAGGVDAGTGTNNSGVLTIGSGRALTINAAQQVAWGSISMQGGSSINLGSGGSLRRSPIWVLDEDADGIIDDTTQYIGSQPTGGVRRNSISNNYSYFSKILNANNEAGSTSLLDCDSGSGFAYRNVANMVTDADNDGYKTSASAATQCVGDSSTINGRTYYENSSGVSTWLPAASALGSGATDCYDNSGAPCPPTAPSIGSTTQTAVNNITWTAATGPAATSYTLQWCSGASCTPSTNITSVSSGYNHTGRTCGTTYRYRVVAVNSSGNSTASSITQSGTSSCGNPPGTPLNPAASVSNPNRTITITWDDPSSGDAPTGFYVYWCSGTSCTPSTQINVGNVNSYQHTDRTCNTTYRYTVQAYNTTGNSSQTSIVQGAMNATTTSAYTDNDGDNQRPSGYSTISICGSSPPSGYTTSTTNTDCYDSNSNARVGQTNYFTTDRGDGSFDYNCDSSITERYSGLPRCTSQTSYYIFDGVDFCYPNQPICTAASGDAACGQYANVGDSVDACYYWICGGNNQCVNNVGQPGMNDCR